MFLAETLAFFIGPLSSGLASSANSPLNTLTVVVTLIKQINLYNGSVVSLFAKMSIAALASPFKKSFNLLLSSIAGLSLEVDTTERKDLVIFVNSLSDSSALKFSSLFTKRLFVVLSNHLE